MLRESTLLISRSLINYTKLKTKSYFVGDSESFIIVTKRPGCPFSEKVLKDNIIKCAYSVMTERGIGVNERKPIIDHFRTTKVNYLGDILENLISTKY